MSEVELLEYVEGKLDTLYGNQEKEIEATSEIHKLLQEQIEKQEKAEAEAKKQAEAEAEKQAEAEAEAQAVAEAEAEAEVYTEEQFMLDMKSYQEQQIELLTGMKESIDNTNNMQMVSVTFLCILIGVTLASIFAKYLKH